MNQYDNWEINKEVKKAMGKLNQNVYECKERNVVLDGE